MCLEKQRRSHSQRHRPGPARAPDPDQMYAKKKRDAVAPADDRVVIREQRAEEDDPCKRLRQRADAQEAGGCRRAYEKADQSCQAERDAEFCGHKEDEEPQEGLAFRRELPPDLSKAVFPRDHESFRLVPPRFMEAQEYEVQREPDR